MYLADLYTNGMRHYEIRQSVFDEAQHGYRYRTVVSLGPDPAHFIFRPSEDICFFADALVDALKNAGDRNPTSTLETLLWSFLPSEERLRLQRFRHRGTVRIAPLTAEIKAAIEREVHLFDRRRLYYIRYGGIDQSRLGRVSPRIYRPLLGMCRDEREFYFHDLERVLAVAELKSYVFSIFDLQRYFHQSYSATMPEALNQDEIADHFVADLCRLNTDQAFWSAIPRTETLHRHLRRYLFMFFDYGYGRRSLFDDFLREFMGRHRAFRWPDKRPSLSTSDIETIFEKTWADLHHLSRKELARLYRRRAKKLHPDSGGDHELFIQLNDAYAALLMKKH